MKGGHHGLVTAKLSKDNYKGALRVAAFLINYYGNGDARSITEPMDTITTKDRLALVTVWIKGEPWAIVDICIRMLKPRELFRAQGFPDSYVIEYGSDGKPLSKKIKSLWLVTPFLHIQWLLSPEQIIHLLRNKLKGPHELLPTPYW